MEKKIQCWVYADDVKNYSEIGGRDPFNFIVSNCQNGEMVLAALEVHDWPEQKIELTKSQIKKVIKNWEYCDIDWPKFYKELGFSED